MNRCWACTPDAVAPSPKSHAKWVTAPSGSAEAPASKSVSAPAAMRSGASMTGAGGAFTLTIRRVSMMVPQPSLAPGSTALRRTARVSGSAKAWRTVGPAAVAPSPKSQAKVAPPTSRSPTSAAPKSTSAPAATRSGPTISIRGASTTVTVVSSVARAPHAPRASPVMERSTV